ncbi:MAG: type II secretion system F family protein [Eubacterium sp.]
MEHLQQNRCLTRNSHLSCGEMGMILRSGISALEGLELLMEDTQNDAEKTLLDTMYQSMQSGDTFADALSRTEVFPSYLIHMTAIGEETGRLDDVMESLSAHYQREESLSPEHPQFLSYPLIMIILMLVVIVILITKVMPVFQQVFARQLGTEMTVSQRISRLAYGSVTLCPGICHPDRSCNCSRYRADPYRKRPSSGRKARTPLPPFP